MKPENEDPKTIRDRMLAERREQPYDAFGDYPPIPSDIISATTDAPVCVYCSERVTKSPGGSLVEHEGDIWHRKCLDRFMQNQQNQGSSP